MNLHNQLAVVTGAASGIGRATAAAFTAAGARVVVADIDQAKGEEAAAALRAAGHMAEYLAVDMTDRASIEGFAARVLERCGTPDVIVNGAGWGKNAPFWEGEQAFWDKIVNLNFIGPMQLVKALLPRMIERGSGRIINIASDAGRVGSLGETVYSAAKGGVIAFTKSLAREAARFGVNVNCVCPGPTDTPLYNRVPEKIREAFTRAIPFRRVAQPQEIADAILFFASSRSDYVTGQILSVSGGLTLAG